MENGALAGCRVLVVEDNYLFAMALIDDLEAAGAIIAGPASDLREAFRALDPLPGIAILDVRLGDETSIPIADELTRLDIPFVFATGTIDAIPASYLSRPIILKPTANAMILKALASMLEPSERFMP